MTAKHLPRHGIGTLVGRKLAQRQIDLCRAGGTIVDNSSELVYIEDSMPSMQSCEDDRPSKW